MIRIPIRHQTIAVGLALCLAGLSGCSLDNRSRSSGVPSDGTTQVFTGDWNDVEASVQHAAGTLEMAVVGEAGFGLEPAEAVGVPTKRCRFELVTGGDEPALVRCWAKETGDPREIEVFAKVGEFGDAVREQRLLELFGARLTELRGRDWAPIGRR